MWWSLAVGEYYTMAFLKIGLKSAMPEFSSLEAVSVVDVTGKGPPKRAQASIQG